MAEIETEKPSYWSIIPATVRYDENLNANEKLLFSEFTCLTNKLGYCYASNNYFAKLYNVTPQAVSKWIKHLEKLGYISCEYEYNGREIKQRRINLRCDVSTVVTKVSTTDEGGINNGLKGYQHTIKDNNTRYNNTSNNINLISEKPKVIKHKFGEYGHVLLSDVEVDKLKAECGSDFDGVIQNYDDYKEMKGYTAKSDYLAIKKWGIRAYHEQNSRQSFSKNNRGKEGEFTEIYRRSAEEEAEHQKMLSDVEYPF